MSVPPAAALTETSVPVLHLPPVRFVVVGARFGAGIARILAESNPWIELVAVCDRDSTLAEPLARELKVPALTDLKEALELKDVEAVGLFTPPNGRAALIREAIRHGKHVLTTKPFERDFVDARAVLHEAAKAGIVVQLNSPGPRPADDIATIIAWRDAYDLGRPVGLQAKTWADYHETFSNAWQDDPERCPAAPLMRLGVYFFNDFLPLMGEATSIHLIESRIRTGRPTSDNALASVAFENGAIGSVFASFCVGDGRPYPDHVSIQFERGRVERWMIRVQRADMSRDYAVIELHRPGQDVIRAETQPGRYAGWYAWDTFHEAVRSAGTFPPQNPEEVVYGLRILDALSRASKSGAPEPVARN